MKLWKVTINYAGRNNLMRSANLIIEAQDETQARIEVVKACGGRFNHATVAKVAYYGEQSEMDLSTPKRTK